MPLSRERAVDLSHRLMERIKAAPGLEVVKDRELVRNQAVKALNDWDRELDKLTADVKKRVSARARRVPEGSRQWDLLVNEELEKELAAYIGRGE
ncbi:MAG: DUF507 family protein [Thermoanaerobaculia bacterium]